MSELPDSVIPAKNCVWVSCVEITITNLDCSEWVTRRPWRVYDWELTQGSRLLYAIPYQHGQAGAWGRHPRTFIENEEQLDMWHRRDYHGARYR